MKKAQFDFDDYLESMNQMKKMGGLSSVMSMMPGLGAHGWEACRMYGFRRRRQENGQDGGHDPIP